VSSIFRFSIPQIFFSPYPRQAEREREREREIKMIVSQACIDKSVLKHAQHSDENYLCSVMISPHLKNSGNLELFKHFYQQMKAKYSHCSFPCNESEYCQTP